MKNHKRSILVLILLLLVAIATTYVGGTYAKYTESVSGNGTATVAKWDFATDNAITNLTIDFTNTYATSTLSAGKIAPGTSGSFAISVKNTHTETGVAFTLTLGSVSNIPTNLKFYKDSTFSTEITPGTGTITGKLAAEDSTGLSVPIYWKWEYETTDGDDEDTTDGKNATTLTVPISITGTQLPTSTASFTSQITTN